MIKIFKAASLCLLVITIFISCQKSDLEVETEKSYVDLNHVPTHDLDGRYSITLYPDGKANMLPTGDIMLRGTYKIKGSKLYVYIKEFQNTEFDILSKKEIRETNGSRILTLVE